MNEKRTPMKQFDGRMRPETRNDDMMCDNLGWRREKNAKSKMTKKMLLIGIWVIVDFVLGIFEGNVEIIEPTSLEGNDN